MTRKEDGGQANDQAPRTLRRFVKLKLSNPSQGLLRTQRKQLHALSSMLSAYLRSTKYKEQSTNPLELRSFSLFQPLKRMFYLKTDLVSVNEVIVTAAVNPKRDRAS